MKVNLLIVVGKITEEAESSFKIRILFDSTVSGTVKITDMNNLDIKSSTTLDGNTSAIVTLQVPNEASYEFEAMFNGSSQHFNFSTTRTPNIAYVSCCGYKSRIVKDKVDNDSETLEKLSKENYDVMIHMGDQIYGEISQH